MKKKIIEEQYLTTPLNNQMLNYNVYVFSKAEKILANLIAFILGGITGLIFYSGLFKVDGYATMATHISNIFFFTVVGFAGIKFLVPMYKNSMLEKRKNVIKLQFRDMLESLSASFLQEAMFKVHFCLHLMTLNYSMKKMIL